MKKMDKFDIFEMIIGTIMLLVAVFSGVTGLIIAGNLMPVSRVLSALALITAGAELTISTVLGLIFVVGTDYIFNNVDDKEVESKEA